jgi:predicted Zn-dependent peptidase
VLGLEDTGSRMTRIGKGELLFDELLSVDQVLARIAAVTLDDVRAVAAQVLALPPTLAVVGPFDGDRDFAAVGVG